MTAHKLMWMVAALLLLGTTLFIQAQPQPQPRPPMEPTPPRQPVQPGQPAQPGMGQQDAPRDAQDMQQRCQQMAQRMEQFQTRARQMDQELQQRLNAVQSAEGEAKVSALAEAMRTLIGQHRQMNEQHMAIMRDMAQHFGQHLMMIQPEGEGSQMMMKCPMMEKRQMPPGRPETMPARPGRPMMNQPPNDR